MEGYVLVHELAGGIIDHPTGEEHFWAAGGIWKGAAGPEWPSGQLVGPLTCAGSWGFQILPHLYYLI
jgi:hypothetical protein